ncbi:MAG: ABC transporter ATP-binding protein [Deltaproteobacteria bacterium]|nr:ABC transporter ATP-binding protein [Deltaproteobacteria bacterium]
MEISCRNEDEHQAHVSRSRYARRLLTDSVRSLGARYPLVVVVTGIIGLTALLPAQLFRFFTESSQSLAAVSAERFLFHFVLFGVGVSLALLLSSAVSAVSREWMRLAVEAGLRRSIMHRLQGSLHSGVFQLLIESFEGMRTIRSQRAESHVLRRFQERLSEISRKSIQVVRYLGVLIGGSEFAGQILVTLCLTAATWGLTRSRITLEQALTYPFFIGLFYNAVQRLASSAYDWNRFNVEGGRLGEFLFHESRCVLPISFSGEAVSLKIKGLQSGYQGGPAANPVSFSLQRGECFAVVGPSGVGKSTFLEVLAGLRPPLLGSAEFLDQDGRVLWRGSDQLPIGPCAFVEQRPYIFEGTLSENLLFGNTHPQSPVSIWNALGRVGLDQFARQRGGLGGRFYDRGKNLSEGERYRIALCRALLLSRPFLLLDEPLASLDVRSREIVISALNNEKARAGIVIVTHFLPEGLAFDSVIDLLQDKIQRGESSLSQPKVISAVFNNPTQMRRIYD